MKYIIATLGCKVNQYESEAMEPLLQSHGHTPCAEGESADAVIVNTCAVTAEGARKARQTVRRLRRENPDALTALCGCWSQVDAAEAASLGADVLFGTGDRQGFVRAVETAAAERGAGGSVTKLDDPFRRTGFEELPAGAYAGHARAYLKIQDGCDNFCTYCIIPFARGRVLSLPEDRCAAEAASLAAQGYKEIVVTGIEIASWGKDLKNGKTLIDAQGESDPSPEEKLLRAIFGDKAGDVKDSSLKANPSLSGVVIDKKLFSRAIKTRASKQKDKVILAKIDEEYEAKIDDLKDILVDKLLTLTEDKVCQGIKDYSRAEIITKGSKFTATQLMNINYEEIQSNNWTDDDHTNGLISKLITNFLKKAKLLDAENKRRKFAITIGDELPSGILQMAKVYIAKKRKIGVGDKLAGRHGNKGIVSKIVRQEDMPFLPDGRPVDLVLNPLGVPSRMNLGQIFEAILGAAGKRLGVKFATPIFDGAHLDDLKEWTDKAGLPNLGSMHLYDGETGEMFDQPATVGITYFLKLGHMVEDKMHARSIGPYSLITQQPLGGKAQFGGQRFGEMEVWALEAFGASHVLQEILTIKSDDVVGRSKAYEAIVKGEPMPTAGIPESLNVLLHELRGLGLSVTLD